MSVTKFLSHALILRDKLLEAVALDAADPLPPVRGKHPDSGEFCLTRVDKLLAERNTEQLLREAIASVGNDRAVAALEAVVDQIETLVTEARDTEALSTQTILALNATIVKAQRYTGKTPKQGKAKGPSAKNKPVVAAIKKGMSVDAVADKFGLSASNVRMLKSRYLDET